MVVATNIWMNAIATTFTSWLHAQSKPTDNFTSAKLYSVSFWHRNYIKLKLIFSLKKLLRSTSLSTVPIITYNTRRANFLRLLSLWLISITKKKEMCDLFYKQFESKVLHNNVAILILLLLFFVCFSVFFSLILVRRLYYAMFCSVVHIFFLWVDVTPVWEHWEIFIKTYEFSEPLSSSIAHRAGQWLGKLVKTATYNWKQANK